MSGSDGGAVIRVGPLLISAGGVRFDSAGGAGCEFTPAGVELWDAGTERRTVPWERVVRVTVAAPGRFRLVRALPAYVLSLLVRSDLGCAEPRGLTVHVHTDHWTNGPSVDLGPVGPYRGRDFRRLDALLAGTAPRVLADPRALATRMAVGQ